MLLMLTHGSTVGIAVARGAAGRASTGRAGSFQRVVTGSHEGQVEVAKIISVESFRG